MKTQCSLCWCNLATLLINGFKPFIPPIYIFFLVENCYVKFEVIDKLRNSLKTHKIMCGEKRDYLPFEITISKG